MLCSKCKSRKSLSIKCNLCYDCLKIKTEKKKVQNNNNYIDKNICLL